MLRQFSQSVAKIRPLTWRVDIKNKSLSKSLNVKVALEKTLKFNE